ncbi:ABC transporter substrate-binding protein [Ruoffia tabacinasalis]|jgi:putative ABC transport system substrate-binding protein|uniref:ABC transporter substrate-binding protein n=1 Tax=Ruoffia tabacinasalis TaxID=87458 RepID=A0ABS0LHN8_9LACT|nr:ABC transporter substrate-binding protein [Ruoffia tabacinasalis]MBG9977703.1 ABC transporter substrate-binding protein [Ruoffia tabacinasalis]
MKSRFKFINIITTVVLALLPILAGGQAVKAQEETINIGVVQYVEHEALDAVLKGFQETLEDSAYGDRIEWDINNASGDQASLQSLSEKVARDNDILFAIATPAAQTLASVEQVKPIFIAAVTDPVEAGLADSMEVPGGNITGTSDMAPIEEQVDLLIRNFPDVKTVGLIYNSSEVNSQVQAGVAVELLEEQGLATEVQTVISTNDIAQVMNALVGNVDAMFMVTDNTIDSAITLVGDIAKEAGIPTIGSSDSVVRTNGLATLSNSYEDYGVQTAEMVIRMLDEDLNPGEMEIELGKDFQIIVNEDFAEAIGVDPSTIE